MAVLVDANFTNAAKLDALQEAARAYRVFNSSSREGEEIAAAIDSAQASVKLFDGSKVPYRGRTGNNELRIGYQPEDL
jgi:hypothetical protein